MARSAIPVGTEPGLSLPILDRIAPPPRREVVAARIDRHTHPGDVVVDLHARGGWVARTAIERHRRAISVESGPLARLVAEIVLRPPDLRHLDAAFQGIAGSARGKTSLRLALAEFYATRCATCDRAVVADDVVWHASPDGDSEALPKPTLKHYRCPACRDQVTGSDHREAPVDDDDRERALTARGAAEARRTLARRFPIPDGNRSLVDQILALHTERQLVGLAAILEQIEGDARGEPVEAALRLAFAHAVLPASRLATHPGRHAPLRIGGGRVRLPSAGKWQERSPWLSFEDGFRLVRSFVQRLEAATPGPRAATLAGAASSGGGASKESGGVPIASFLARIGDDIRSLADGPASAVVRLASPATWRAIGAEARQLAERPARPRLALVLCQPPPRRTAEAVAFEFHSTAWAVGRDAASSISIDTLLRSSGGPSWWSQAAALGRSLEAVEPLLQRDAKVVLLVEGDQPEALVAAALGGVAAGFRVVAAQLGDPDEHHAGVVELIPPGAVLPPAPRTRANVPLPAIPGGAGDPDVVPGPGLFAPPERYDARPFSATDSARAVTATAVDVLRARGEPAATTRLFGEIVVALDRGGHLRRLVEASAPGDVAHQDAASNQTAASKRDAADGTATQPDPVDRLVAIVRDELARPNRRRLVEVAPDRWWLADRGDRESAAAPLADRVEWAVYSLLSTSGSLSESAFLDRIGGLFQGHDRPDEALIRACLDSYRADGSNAERVTTTEDLLARTHEHGMLLAALADGGHRLGMRVWIASREQARRLGERRLGDSLGEAERRAHLAGIARGPVDALESVDCIWYVPGRATFLFEVEWTAMIGETVLRRHARIPADDEVVRFLIVPPERTALVRHKVERSPLLRDALAAGNWHVLKWNHLRDFLANEPLSLDGLEPYLGLDPPIERGEGQQLPLFAAER